METSNIETFYALVIIDIARITYYHDKMRNSFMTKEYTFYKHSNNHEGITLLKCFDEASKQLKQYQKDEILGVYKTDKLYIQEVQIFNSKYDFGNIISI